MQLQHGGTPPFLTFGRLFSVARHALAWAARMSARNGQLKRRRRGQDGLRSLGSFELSSREVGVRGCDGRPGRAIDRRTGSCKTWWRCRMAQCCGPGNGNGYHQKHLSQPLTHSSLRLLI
jgi:hypothetical protein